VLSARRQHRRPHRHRRTRPPRHRPRRLQRRPLPNHQAPPPPPHRPRGSSLAPALAGFSRVGARPAVPCFAVVAAGLQTRAFPCRRQLLRSVAANRISGFGSTLEPSSPDVATSLRIAFTQHLYLFPLSIFRAHLAARSGTLRRPIDTVNQLG
jgi:hypothetical protein